MTVDKVFIIYLRFLEILIFINTPLGPQNLETLKILMYSILNLDYSRTPHTRAWHHKLPGISNLVNREFSSEISSQLGTHLEKSAQHNSRCRSAMPQTSGLDHDSGRLTIYCFFLFKTLTI